MDSIGITQYQFSLILEGRIVMNTSRYYIQIATNIIDVTSLRICDYYSSSV
jgi:hypothetical protein